MFSTPNTSHLSNGSSLFSAVYPPSEDTFFFLDVLEAEAKTGLKEKIGICLEIGCGSGCISAFIAQICGQKMMYLCTDISASAVACTRETGSANKVLLNPIQADLITGLRSNVKMEILVFNPPYVPTEAEEFATASGLARAWSGGWKGREVLDRLLPKLSLLISETGWIYLLGVEENHPDEIIESLNGLGFSAKVIARRRAGREKLWVIKGSKTKLD